VCIAFVENSQFGQSPVLISQDISVHPLQNRLHVPIFSSGGSAAEAVETGTSVLVGLMGSPRSRSTSVSVCPIMISLEVGIDANGCVKNRLGEVAIAVLV